MVRSCHLRVLDFIFALLSHILKVVIFLLSLGDKVNITRIKVSLEIECYLGMSNSHVTSIYYLSALIIFEWLRSCNGCLLFVII